MVKTPNNAIVINKKELAVELWYRIFTIYFCPYKRIAKVFKITFRYPWCKMKQTNWKVHWPFTNWKVHWPFTNCSVSRKPSIVWICRNWLFCSVCDPTSINVICMLTLLGHFQNFLISIWPHKEHPFQGVGSGFGLSTPKILLFLMTFWSRKITWDPSLSGTWLTFSPDY